MKANTSTETALVAERCWDGLAETPSGHTEVLVRGGRIVEVGDRVGRGTGQVVDLGDRLLLPGFIDCHMHTTVDPSALLTAFVADPATVITLRALPVLRDLPDRGFTTVRDLATFAAEPITIYLRDALANGLIIGPRMLVAPHLISARGAHGDISTLLAPEYGREIGVLADGAAALTRAVREEIRTGADWIKFGAMFPHHRNWREFPAMVHTGISPLRALRAATSTAADLLQRPDLGRIRPGATADLIAVRGNPFDDIDATGGVDFVMHDGVVHRPVAMA
ncbi:amidohydrolase family protein [Dactylosporangium sp. CA-152071]|uniref:amidohydrolase family protein n=1 Tax=Dactylosporangium sp. CA-152071 TaxID=3239933 RepID=UPI003D8BE30F